MSGRLAGKVAVVTGGARGMGEATVRRFVAEGAKVAIADVLESEGAALAEELGEAAMFRKLDVTSEDEWTRVAGEVEAEFGPIDVLVNNAGILLFSTLLQTSLDQFRRVLDVNLVGSFLGMKAVGPGMVERGRGSIVNISSVDGMKASNGLAAYASSKWGVRGLTRTAALEFGHKGVRVNSVHPGGVDTAMINAERQGREELDKRFTNIALQRAGEPGEVAAMTLFLASDESSYVNGSEFVVDGGMLAGTYYEQFPGAPGV